MGSKREKRPGVWELRVYQGVVGGKKRWASRTFYGGERDAGRALSNLETEVSAGSVTAGKTTVNRMLDMYVQSRTPGWSPSTRRDQPQTLDRWVRPVLGKLDVAKVRPLDVEQLVATIAIEHPATARKVLAILRSAFEDAVRWEIVARNPARSVRRPHVAKPETAAPPLELVREVIDAADPAMKCLVRLAVVTGCRRGELLGLRWDDFNLEVGSVAVSRAAVEDHGVSVKGTKTGRVKVLALDARTVESVKVWRAQCREDALAFGARLDGFVFAQRPDGVKPWNPSTLSHKWRVLADAHGLSGFRFHDLRHATATTLIAAGVDPKTAADRLGHDPSVMLGIYTHALPARDQAAAEIMGASLDGTRS